MDPLNANLALVTGASGFVGSRLMRRLAETGRPIRALYHSQASTARASEPQVEWVGGDLTKCSLDSLVRGVTTVFHLAGLAVMTDGPEETARMTRINTDATIRLARASKEAGVRRFIFVSSADAGELAATPDVDEQNGEPIRAYGRSKRSAEVTLLELSSDDFSVTILRPTALFGEEHLGSLYELARGIIAGRFALIGAGDNRMNFYYIDDFIDVLVGVEGRSSAFGEVFIAADEPQPLREFSTVLASLVRPGFRVPSIPKFVGVAAGALFDVVAVLTRKPMPLSRRRVARMTRDVAYRNAKLIRLLGIEVRVGWREGLRRTIEWFRGEGLL